MNHRNDAPVFAHCGSLQPCPVCGYFGTHVHTTEDAERIRKTTADELLTTLERQAQDDIYG
jgi:hypothetical protein